MWISERGPQTRREQPADLGQVTLGGDPAGVYLNGERRWLTVYGPGGYTWRPGAGDRVLVLKAGEGREVPCIAGTRQAPGDLAPGEVRVTGPAGAIHLDPKGVRLLGPVWVGGLTLEELIDGRIAKALSPQGGE